MNTNNLKAGSTFNYANQLQVVTKITVDGVIKFKNATGNKGELSAMQFESNYYGFIENVKP